MSGIPLVARARQHGERPALRGDDGAYSYAELLDASARVASALVARLGPLDGRRVAFMVPPGCGYVAAQWGIWRAGGVAVPLALMHPPPELRYTLGDCGAAAVIAHAEYAALLAPLAGERELLLLALKEVLAHPPGVPALPAVEARADAMVVYTSGTTGKPKGVVTTHANLEAQITALVEAWGWTAEDRILNVLPLHHLHGILNVTCCALWAGATCEMLPKFDAEAVWTRIARGDLSLFMAVPTIYSRLTRAWEQADAATREQWSAGCRTLRLMVSGSAALPVPVLERWRAISGHTLLERYGMSEIGMALSNPLHGERRPGWVGSPLPRVETRIVDEAFADVPEGEAGQLLIRGPAVFREYLGRPDATRAAFRDGWFLTGDVAVRESNVYRLLGRDSVDIIKTGGFKVSALEIEAELRLHPGVADCAVVGVPDEEWGERVCAALVAGEGAAAPSLEDLRAWAKDRLAVYKIPSRTLVLDDLPRNAMGKVTKPDVRKLFESKDGPA